MKDDDYPFTNPSKRSRDTDDDPVPTKKTGMPVWSWVLFAGILLAMLRGVFGVVLAIATGHLRVV